MAEEGRLLYLGDRAKVSAAAIAHVIAGLLETPNWVARLARRSAELVDGRGAERVARYFSTPALRLRRARLEDCRAVHEWRNDEQKLGNIHMIPSLFHMKNTSAGIAGADQPKPCLADRGVRKSHRHSPL